MTDSAALPDRTDVLVVGAGLSGLACAGLLQRAGVDVHLVDAADAVGGRVRTDEVDGFLLDRGFQVLLTAYEEVQAQIDLARLDVRAFRPGSMVWNGEALQTMGDPFRDPASALASMSARVGSLGDKMKVASLRRSLLSGSAEACFEGPERSTQEELEALGFSADFIDTFFRPFLGGVFLERGLETSASLFRYYFRCFAAGDVVVPAHGMQRLPELMAGPLGGRITLGARVTEVRVGSVVLDDGTTVDAREVIVATDGAMAAKLLDGATPDFKATVTSYFAAPQAPVDEPMLVLDGEGTGPVNHVAVMSNVSPDYAPAGMHLVSASGVDAAAEDPEGFVAAAPAQLRRWFGASVDRWEHLRTYRIADALPRHPAGSLGGRSGGRRAEGLVVAGDYMEFGAIQGALLSGRRAAEAVLAAR
jgi:phytoene dehydrogenase-like protein